MRLASGRSLRYETLVLAVGARNRTLSLKGAELDGVCYLRTDAEAVEIQATSGTRPRYRRDRRRIHRPRTCGGRPHAREVGSRAGGPASTDAEGRLPHPLRFLSRPSHQSRRRDLARRRARGDRRVAMGRVSEVVLSDGTVCPADLVLVGIGVVPNIELARDAGLAVSNGIVVDEQLRTEDEKHLRHRRLRRSSQSIRRRARAARIGAECDRPGQMHRGRDRGPR